MTRELAGLVMAAVAVLILALMWWGWRRRSRRDAGLIAPTTMPVEAAIRARFEGFYVATTRHDAPLDRLSIRHLAFRGRAVIEVGDAGVALHIPGEPSVFIAADRLIGAGRATWTIDRVVETDGLVILAWNVPARVPGGADTPADSYLRVEGAASGALVDQIERLTQTPASTGSHA